MVKLTPLSNDTLTAMEIDVPRYDRSTLTPGIVHIGVGNFHRAHQAWYLHRLMQQGVAQDWAIIGAGVQSYDAAMRDKLIAQDCLTTLIELDPSGNSAEVIGSMVEYLPVEKGNGALIAQMANPSIRIVSLTVTESGYFIDPATGGPDLAHPDLQSDIANMTRPATAFGAIVRALQIRRNAGLKPFSVQSCDNLTGNGDITRRLVVGLAERVDVGLAEWLAQHGAFPNSMVDCIVPATGPNEIAKARGFGVDDAAPVTHENYRQWVIEDQFCNGRPTWEAVGAVLTDNVHAYEAMKIRVLNAGHQVLANVGELLSVETIAGCMADPAIRAFFTKVETTQIVPTVSAVPNMTPNAYLDLIERRFENPEIHDTTRRVSFDGSSRHPGFVLPILHDLLETGAEIDGLCLVEALWAKMCAGKREDDSEIAPNDPRWDSLNAVAIRAKEDPVLWLEQHSVYGELATNAQVCERFSFWLHSLFSQGCIATLDCYVSGKYTNASTQTSQKKAVAG